MGLLANAVTVISNGPTTATSAKAIAQGGPIMDYPGMTQNLLLSLEEIKVSLTKLIADTDAGDPSLATLNTMLSAL